MPVCALQCQWWIHACLCITVSIINVFKVTIFQAFVQYFSSSTIINTNGIKLRRIMLWKIQVLRKSYFGRRPEWIWPDSYQLADWINLLIISARCHHLISAVAGLGGGGDPGSCKIVATLSNGTIKTLCDTKETLSMTEDLTQLMDRRLDPSNDISHLMDRRLDPSKDLTQLMDRRLDPSKDPSQLTNGRLGPSKDPSQMSPSLRLVQPSQPPPPQSQSLHHSLHTDCNCSYPLYSDQGRGFY